MTDEKVSNHKGGWPKGKPRKNLTGLPEIISIAIVRDKDYGYKSLTIHSIGTEITKVEDSEPNLKGIIIQRTLDFFNSQEIK
jgi:hypothetical protein